VAARQGVPQCHVNTRQSHADRALSTQQPESAEEFLLISLWGELFALQ
jgi:hypothetical protein